MSEKMSERQEKYLTSAEREICESEHTYKDPTLAQQEFIDFCAKTSKEEVVRENDKLRNALAKAITILLRKDCPPGAERMRTRECEAMGCKRCWKQYFIGEESERKVMTRYEYFRMLDIEEMAKVVIEVQHPDAYCDKSCSCGVEECPPEKRLQCCVRWLSQHVAGSIPRD